jgi:hypothetical protein
MLANARAFAFQGRGFVDRACESVGAPDLCRENTGRVCVRRYLPMPRDRQPRGSDTIAEQPHRPIHKAPSVLRAGIDAAMGQCRGRTHIPMALCQPRRQRPCRRDRNEQACRPIYPNGPRHGRLEVECGRSAGGSSNSPGFGGFGMAERNHREPRG